GAHLDLGQGYAPAFGITLPGQGGPEDDALALHVVVGPAGVVAYGASLQQPGQFGFINAQAQGLVVLLHSHALTSLQRISVLQSISAAAPPGGNGISMAPMARCRARSGRRAGSGSCSRASSRSR